MKNPRRNNRSYNRKGNQTNGKITQKEKHIFEGNNKTIQSNDSRFSIINEDDLEEVDALQ